MIYLKCGDKMKKILKIIGIIFIVIYCVISITLTICLLNYNDYNITVLGDKIFFYDKEEEQVTVNLGTIVSKKNITKTETTYTMNGDYPISSEYLIGKTETSKVYHGLGSVLSVLESRFGFLFLIIFPILILFIYEVFIVIKEVKTPDEE